MPQQADTTAEYAYDTGRKYLADWLAAQPDNFYAANGLLQDLVARYATAADLPRLDQLLRGFGAQVAAADALVHRCSHEPGTPVLERWDAVGRRQERVHFDDSYHTWGAQIYGTGVMSVTGQAERAIEQAVLMLLSSHQGEAGHNCPLACTCGMIKAIQKVGHPRLQQALLPGLLDPNYATHLHGSQFLTEIQGGSDVGANACQAELVLPETAEHPALWRLHGEKWFCSVVDAPVHLVTARPVGGQEGTKGLGLFLVPHDLPDPNNLQVLPLLPFGQTPRPVNHFTIRRLKNKLGTRAMASAELDWNGALAWQLGPLDQGFRNVVEIVLDTSRLFNALAVAGSMWRAYWQAATYAEHRRAFTKKIGAFGIIHQSIGQLWIEAAAATAGTLDLIAAQASGQHLGAVRMALNANKYWTSIRNTQMQRLAIEVLGGNGAIEDFSVLPRLYRDAIVTESWEGSHSVLAAQTVRDMQRLGLHKDWLDWLEPRVLALPVTDLHVRFAAMRDDADRVVRLAGQDSTQAGRIWMESAMVVHQATCLLEMADWQEKHGQPVIHGKAIAQFLALHPWHQAVREPGWWPGQQG